MGVGVGDEKWGREERKLEKNWLPCIKRTKLADQITPVAND